MTYFEHFASCSISFDINFESIMFVMTPHLGYLQYPERRARPEPADLQRRLCDLKIFSQSGHPVPCNYPVTDNIASDGSYSELRCTVRVGKMAGRAKRYPISSKAVETCRDNKPFDSSFKICGMECQIKSVMESASNSQ